MNLAPSESRLPNASPPAPRRGQAIVVLMPVYNCNDDAWRTIASFDEPDLGDIHVLVVDDGSEPPFDPNRRVPGRSASSGTLHIDVLRLAQNGGIERALASGVDALLADGVRYIARMDAGDLALPGRLSKQLHYLDGHPHVGAVGMWAQAVTRAGIPVFMMAPPASPAAIRRLRFARSCFIHPAMTLRADAIRRSGNYSTSYPAAEDLDLFLRIMQNADCANLPEPGILYELNEGGISATRRRKQVRSTLRLQLRYFAIGNLFDWIGLAKNLAHLVVPYALLQRVKRRFMQAPVPSSAPPSTASPHVSAPLKTASTDASVESANQGRTSPLHVCMVSNTAWAIYNYRLGLLNALLKAGAVVTIIAPSDRTFSLLEAMGCRCIPLSLSSKGTSPLQDLRTLASLYRCYKQSAPDIVFHYTIKPNIYGTLAAAAAGVPSVAVTTGLGYVFLHANRAAKIARALYRLAFRFPREIWFLNPDDRNAFLSEDLLVHPERARLLRGEGVNLQHFAVQPRARDGVFRFLLIGRLLWDKGVGEFIEAARRLKDHFPEARWQLLGPVGVANPSAISQQEVDAWCAEGLVEYLGEAHDVRPHIANADCIVLPSYREGVPRTLLEAAAMGKMAIATRVPGCVEVVEDGVNGILCEVRDAAKLAEAMQRALCLSPQQRQVMETAARHKAEQEFDERVVIAAYQRTLDQVCGKTISL